MLISRSSVCSALLASLACLFAFSGLSIKASAADTAFLSKADTRALYGDTIPFTYISGSTGLTESGTFTLTSFNTNTRITGGWNVPDLPSFLNWEYLLYSSAWGIDVSLAQNVTVELNPQYSITDTENFSAFIALSTDYDVSSSAYNQSVWECRSSVAGSVMGYSPAVNGFYSISGFRGSGAVDKYVVCPINFQNQSSGAFSSIQCRFQGCGVSTSSGMNQRLYLLVACPRVTVGFGTSSGTVSETSASTSESSGGASGGGSGDMEETNSLLSGVISAIQNLASSIWSGIVAVFVPTSQDIADFKSDLIGLLQDTFSPLYTAGVLTKQVFDQIYIIGQYDLTLPAIEIPAVSGNDAFTLISAQSVDVMPEGVAFEVLYKALKAVIDIVCTISVLNMLRNKIDGILVGEVAVSHVD